MRQTGKCPKCGCPEIVQEAMVADRADYNIESDLHLRVDADPEAIMFRGRTRSSLKAYVCGGCGYVEFYASDPESLLKAFREAQRAGRNPIIG